MKKGLGLAGAFAAALIGQPVIMPERISVPQASVRSINYGGNKGKQRQRIGARFRRRAAASDARRYARRGAKRPTKEQLELRAAVNSLTNWQRSRWANAGYPGLRDTDADQVKRFAEMRRAA